MKKNVPVRIAHIMGKWIGGGVEAVVMNYYKNIDHHKIQFDFICDEDSTDIPYKEIEALGGKVILVTPYQHVLKYQKEMIKILKEGNYKIVHSHINTLSVFPLRAAKRAGVPVRIAHSHSTTNKKELKKNIIKNILKPFAKLYATDYFACTEHAGRWLFGNKEFDNGNVYLLNNAIELEKFRYNEEIRKSKREELNINDDTLVIGHIGRFVAQKNHTFLVDIFNEVLKQKENAVLLLIGQGPLQEDIGRKVKDLGISNKVRFLGQREDVNELYQAMDVFVFPSLYEGLGMVLIEAQCSGLCCIASTEVPNMAKVTDNLEFIQLSETSQKWAENTVVLLNKNNRKDYSKEVSNAGYNIVKEAKKIENKYIEKVSPLRILQCGMTDNLGGIESFIMNYLRYIDHDKVQFDFINIYPNKLCFQDEIEKRNGKVYKVPNYYKRPISYIKTVKKIIKKNNYNIIHCNMNSAVMLYPLIAAKLAGAKIIISHSHNSSNDKGIVKSLLHNINKIFIPFLATNFFACSEKAGEWFFSKRIRNSNKYCVIYNAINTEDFKYDREKRIKKRQELNINDENFVIGHVGRFNKQKNHSFIIDVFNKYLEKDKNAILLLIGKGPLYEEIKTKVDFLGLTESVKFLGQRTDVNELMCATDAFLLPSLYEGLPLVGVEAQSSGLKCYFSDTITKKLKIIEDVKYIQHNNDAEEWAKIIYDDKKKIDREKCFKDVTKSEYNIRVAVDKLVDQYNQMLIDN